MMAYTGDKAPAMEMEHHDVYGKFEDHEDGLETIKQYNSHARATAPITTTTKEEEAAVIRKLDWNIMPLIFVLYSLSVLDRSNLGNAKIAGMEDDINIGGNRYAWLGTAFYIACSLASIRLCTSVRLTLLRYPFPMDPNGLESLQAAHVGCLYCLLLGHCLYPPGGMHYLEWAHDLPCLPRNYRGHVWTRCTALPVLLLP